ncbi:MAG: hypothetical protein ACE37F_26070 [Nannocystaceae bacterium]|nr:hypothetical protein [bacterium]
MTDEVAAFVEVVDNLYGVYLDAGLGFMAIAKQVCEGQDKVRGEFPPGTDLDALPQFIGRGSPNDAGNVMQHKTTQGQFKARNAKGGHNQVLLGQMLLVLLYEHWESEHRARVAAAIGIPRKDLKASLFGDLRLVRNDIIHCRGIIQEKTIEKLEVVQGLVVGEVLRLSEDAVEETVRAIKRVLDNLVVEHGGEDPKHRTVWRVR